jgi:hypothetical protein
LAAAIVLLMGYDSNKEMISIALQRNVHAKGCSRFAR